MSSRAGPAVDAAGASRAGSDASTCRTRIRPGDVGPPRVPSGRTGCATRCHRARRRGTAGGRPRSAPSGARGWPRRRRSSVPPRERSFRRNPETVPDSVSPDPGCPSRSTRRADSSPSHRKPGATPTPVPDAGASRGTSCRGPGPVYRSATARASLDRRVRPHPP